MADLETEKEQLTQQLSQSQQQINTLKTDCGRISKLELDLLTANNETQKIKRSLDAANRKLQEVEKDRTDIESENSKVFHLKHQ